MPDAELHLPPDVRYVGLARMVVCAAARLEGMDEERVEDLRIAVSEATTNAMVSRSGEAADGPIVLCFGPGAGGFSVTVRDTVPWLTTRPREAPDLPTNSNKDLAVTLLRGLADDVELLPAAAGHVHLRFCLALEADVESGNGRTEGGDPDEQAWPGPAEASA